MAITIGGSMQQREELELLRWRISFIGYTIVAVLLMLACGYWNVQIIQSGYYQQRAEQNRIREIPLRAPRGRIYDRNHRVLADNRPSYDIILMRENSPHTADQTAAMLSAGISMSKDELLERVLRVVKRREPKFRPIILKEDVSVGDIAYVKAHRYELPEISVEYSRCVCECSGSLYPGLVRRYTVGPVDIGSAPMSATSAPGGILASSFSAGIHFASANCATR